MPSFSARNGYSAPRKEILYREDLPQELRRPIVKILRSYIPEAVLREVQKQISDPYGLSSALNFAPLEFQRDESDDAFQFRRFMQYGPWFQVYDIIEETLEQLRSYEREENTDPDAPARYEPLQRELNDYFIYVGIGWQVVDGKVLARGNENFEDAVNTAASSLRDSFRPTSANQIQSAIRALSERPKANTSVAVSQATNAVESLLNDITGEALTLGKFLDKHPKLFHPALRKGLDSIYGYASDEGARHGKEGVEPSFEAAQFVITICAATCTLLTATNPKERR